MKAATFKCSSEVPEQKCSAAWHCTFWAQWRKKAWEAFFFIYLYNREKNKVL